MSTSLAMRTLHSVENDGITPQLFALLAKERKGSEMQSAPVVIPPTLVFERGFVKAMYSTEVSRVDGDRLIPMENEDLPKKALNMNTATAQGFRLEVKKKLGRDVIIKEVFEEFTQDAKDNDIVACLMLCQYQDRDDYSGFRYLDKEGLRKFLMETVERPRAMLQKFIKPKGASNTLVFAVWSPLVLVAEGRRAVHALHEPAVSADDRGVTFESDDVRLVRDLALPRTVIDEITTTCQAIKTHVEHAERGLTLTRLACYFKIDEFSTLHMVAATSIRLQRVSRPEIRHPLDLNCGAGSPLRSDRQKAQSKIDAQLAECQEKQDVLQQEMTQCLPRGMTGSIVEEGRNVVDANGRRVASSSLSRSRRRFDGDGGGGGGDTPVPRSGSVHQRAQSTGGAHTAVVRSSLVLPNGEEFPGRTAIASSSSSVSPSPAAGRPPSWQRHREHMEHDGGAAGPSSGNKTAIQKILSGIHRSNSQQPAAKSVVREQMRGAAPTTVDKRKSSWQPGLKNRKFEDEEAETRAMQKAVEKQLLGGGGGGGGNKKDVIVIAPTAEEEKRQHQKPPRAGVLPTAASTPPPEQIAQKQHSSATAAARTPPAGLPKHLLHGGGSASSPKTGTATRSSSGAGYRYGSSASSSSAPPVHIGGTVDSNTVLDALSSVPRSSNAPPFSSTFTRRIAQEERVSRSWHSFLNKQRSELASIVSASPAQLGGAGGGGGGGSGSGGGGGGVSHSQPFDTTTSNLSNASFSNVFGFMQRKSEPPPAGDMSVDFDAVTRRSLRHKHAEQQMLGAAGGGGGGAGGSHHQHHGSAPPPTLDPETSLYSRSLRAAQSAYMSPARTASMVFHKHNAGGSHRSSSIFSPSQSHPHQTPPPPSAAAPAAVPNDNDHQDATDTTQLPDAPTATPFMNKSAPQKQQEEQEEDDEQPLDVPQLIDESQLPSMPERTGQPAHSVHLPSGTPQQVPNSIVMPNVFSNTTEEEAALAQQQAQKKKSFVSTKQRGSNSNNRDDDKAPTTVQSAEAKQKTQDVLDGNVVVHEATEKIWYLRSAHPEISEVEMKKQAMHSGTAQVDNVQSFFVFVRRVMHRLRALCRDSVRQRRRAAVFFELPMEFPRASITMDDVSAMFQPMKCTICSRADALKRAVPVEFAHHHQRKKSWKELMDLRIRLLALLDEEYYTQMFEFPLTENPATADFFAKEGMALALELPEQLLDSLSNDGEDSKTHSQQKQELMDVLDDNDASADALCGLDYLLSLEVGAVAYTCLKNLPIKEKRNVVL